MPTIQQLPTATSAGPADEVLISQSGTTVSVSVGNLLAGTQPAIMAPQGTLLGRQSLGAGGPETVAVGTGLSFSNAALSANGADHATYPVESSLSLGDQAVLNSGGTPKLLPITSLRGLFSAGSNVAIDSSGVISAAASESSSYSISAQSTVSTIASADLVGISQNGVDHTITYENLLNGQTIDIAQPAAPASDTDTFWVAQASNTMLRQTLSAVWSWIATKLPTYKTPVVEITVDTTLDGTVHNGRVLVCSQPVTLSPVFANMGNGFSCVVINASTGAVTLGAGIVPSTGSSTLPSGQAANLYGATYSGGSVIFACMTGVASGGSTQTTVPGQVTSLETGTITNDSVALAWSAPSSGGGAASYVVQYRVTGTTAWASFAAGVLVTTETVTGLAAATQYDFCVLATNAEGNGAASTTISATTLAGGNVTSISWNLPPSGPYTAGSGTIGVNVLVTPAAAAVQFGFSTSATSAPTTWTAGTHANTNVWAAYVPTPAAAGAWYAWAEGTDGSSPTVYPTSFSVT